MAWLTVDDDGRETIFAGKPTNIDEKGSMLGFWIEDSQGHFDYGHCRLPKGTILNLSVAS